MKLPTGERQQEEQQGQRRFVQGSNPHAEQDPLLLPRKNLPWKKVCQLVFLTELLQLWVTNNSQVKSVALILNIVLCDTY